jgi:anti-anti-sigma factor
VTASSRSQNSARARELLSVETTELSQLRARVRVAGDLDASTGAPLWAVLQSHLAAGRRFLRVDLSGVAFLDAAALSGLTKAHHDALARRGTLVLTGVTMRLARVLRLTGLDRVLFVGGPRADDDIGLDTAISDDGRHAGPVSWAARPVPWTPPAVARSNHPAPGDR